MESIEVCGARAMTNLGRTTMANDLEKFLQQAAERLAQKANAAGRGQVTPPRPAVRLPQQAGQAQRTSQSQYPAQAPQTFAPESTARQREMAQMARGGSGGRFSAGSEVVQAEILDFDPPHLESLRDSAADPLSRIDARPSLAQSISQADERMVSHVHQMLDQQTPRTASTSLGGSQANQSNRPTEVSARETYKSPLLSMLRDPQSLRAAFIVGEIFNRRP